MCLSKGILTFTGLIISRQVDPGTKLFPTSPTGSQTGRAGSNMWYLLTKREREVVPPWSRICNIQLWTETGFKTYTSSSLFSRFTFRVTVRHIPHFYWLTVIAAWKNFFCHGRRCINPHLECIPAHSTNGSCPACSFSAGNRVSSTNRSHSHLELIRNLINAVDRNPCAKWSRRTQVMVKKLKT